MTAVADDTGTHPTNDVLTEEVRVLLARHNLRPKVLCGVLGLSQQGVSHRMTGRRQWSLDDMDALARFFGVDANALLPGLGQTRTRVKPALAHATVPYRAAADQAPDERSGEATLP